MTNRIASFKPFKRYAPFKKFNQRRFQVRLSRFKENDLQALGQRIQASPSVISTDGRKSFLVFPIARDHGTVGRYLARIILRSHFDG